MRVAVFRALDDGRRTAEQLAQRGHVAVLAPVLRIVQTGATVVAGTADALVFTSAHAPEALSRHPDGVAHLQDLPCWCVGGRTAKAARHAGFVRVRVGTGDAVRLAAAIVAERGPSRLALVAGRDRKPDLEQALARAGVVLSVTEVYAAEALTQWSGTQAASLASAVAALHYSRRSALLACGLANIAGLRDRFRTWTHHCLSDDVAVGLAASRTTTIVVAERPDEPALLASLER